MGTKRYVNRRKSGAEALPAKLRRRPLTDVAPRTDPPRAHSPKTGHPRGRAWFDSAVHALADCGWFRCRGFLHPSSAQALASEARALWGAGAFRQAAFGRGAHREVEPDVRGDWLHWIDAAAPTAPQREFLELMDAFRRHLNRELYLPLHELELQYAVYPPGTFYRRHVDQFRDVRARLITVLLYLNPGWKPEDGGAFRLYAGPDAAEPAADVVPALNTFVCFRSERIPHEVLAPSRHRFSLGGWFRVRSEVPL